LCQAPIAPDPDEEPLDDPTPWLNGEADLIGVFAHDLDGNQSSLGDLLTRIPAVGEDPLDEREDTTRGPQKRPTAVAILNARRMWFEHEATPVRIDEGMALTSVDLFPGIVAARPASLGRFDALAVDDCACGTGLAADPFAIEHDQGVVDLLEATLVAERRKPAIDCAPRRQIARQQTPRTARPHHIEDAVDDLSHWPCTRPSRTLRSRQVGLNHAPFLIGHVSLVSVRLTDMLHSSGLGPHRVSGVGLSNPLESRPSQPLNLFRNGLLYQIPGILTRCGFPNQRDSDSRWRTKEVRHVDSDTVAWGFQGVSATRLGEEDEGRAAGPAPPGTCCDL